MKLLQIVLMLIFISIGPVTAQQEYMGRKTAEQRTALMTKNLVEKLNLSTSQSDSVSEVILKREKLRDAGKLSPEKKKETDKQIKSILTKEQTDQWQEMRKEAHEKHKAKKSDPKKEELVPDSE